jgi:isoamylase
MLVRLKLDEPVLHRPKFFQGRPLRGQGIQDVFWLEPNGKEMTDEAWSSNFVRSLGVYLPGDAIYEVDERGDRLVGNTLLLLLNAHHEAIPFELPNHHAGYHRSLVFDTSADQPAECRLEVGATYRLQARSMAVFRLENAREES